MTATFEDLNRSTDRTLSLAKLGRRRTRHWDFIRGIIAVWVLPRYLESMLASFDYETLNKLSPDESLSLTSKLQSLHASLLAMLPSPETVQGIPILRTNIGRLREDTEDLGDLIENLILGSDLNFQKFVSDSVGEVVSK